MYSRAKSQLSEARYETASLKAEADSLRNLGDGVFAKLVATAEERDLAFEEKRVLGMKLSGKVIEATELRLKLGKISSSSSSSKPDTVYISEKQSSSNTYIYSYSNKSMGITVNGISKVISSVQPDSVKNNVSVKADQAVIRLFTSRLSETEYEIRAKSESEWLEIGDVKTVVVRDKIKKNSINFGAGFGAAETPEILTGASYGRHSLFAKYNTSTGKFGAQYIFMVKI